MDLGGAGRVDILRTMAGCAETSDGPDEDSVDIPTLSNQCLALTDQIHSIIGGALVDGWMAPA